MKYQSKMLLVNSFLTFEELPFKTCDQTTQKIEADNETEH